MKNLFKRQLSVFYIFMCCFLPVRGMEHTITNASGINSCRDTIHIQVQDEAGNEVVVPLDWSDINKSTTLRNLFAAVSSPLEEPLSLPTIKETPLRKLLSFMHEPQQSFASLTSLEVKDLLEAAVFLDVKDIVKKISKTRTA